MHNVFTKRLQIVTRQRLAVAVGLLALVGAGAYGYAQIGGPKRGHSEVSSQSRKGLQRYTPSPAEWASLTIQPVTERGFRAENVTEGKIAIDEDRSTPVFSPYAGRVTKLLAKPGDSVVKGQPLFVIEAADNVQAQNDFIARDDRHEQGEVRARTCAIAGNARQGPVRRQGRSAERLPAEPGDADPGENDMRSSETAMEAARNKLRILGLTDEDIATFQEKRRINPETTIFAPIAGTVVQRKIGPGQYVNAGASDPVYVIGDLSTVWMTAFVRESDCANVAIGQEVTFNVLALPGRPLSARINYVATAIDPATRRLLVRATIDNKDGMLKPEMFANVTIYSAGDRPAVGVPKQALIYEGDQVRIWVAHPDKTIELRQIKPGLTNGDLVEVVGNLKPGEQIVTKGALFIDRAASGS